VTSTGLFDRRSPRALRFSDRDIGVDDPAAGDGSSIADCGSKRNLLRGFGVSLTVAARLIAVADRADRSAQRAVRAHFA